MDFAAAHEALPPGDYVAPDLAVILPDAAFPHMVRGNVADNDWRYLRRHIPHIWYVDARSPQMGFVSRDEAAILYNQALHFAGAAAVEIGCWRGWSSVHLALGGVMLDIIDPALADTAHRDDVAGVMERAGVSAHVHLHPVASPDALTDVAAARATPWSLAFIDGDHEGAASSRDALAVLPHMADDCAILFHDVASPDVAAALEVLEGVGFNIRLFQTMQIMAIAWRGRAVPVAHRPDPAIHWEVPHHLLGWPISGMQQRGWTVAQRDALAASEAALVQAQAAHDTLQIANSHAQAMLGYMEQRAEAAERSLSARLLRRLRGR